MERLRVLIADDEPPARAKLRRFLQAEPDLELVAEAGSGAEAVERIQALRPDLVFLDVQMPESDGFGVIAALGKHALPQVVFVTAYDEYAVRAFEVHAVDYLLKPFDAGRFTMALERARQRHRQQSADELDSRLRRVLAEVRPTQEPLERLLVPTRDGAIFINVADIDWLQTEDNYVRLHTGSTSHLLRATLSALEQRLDAKRFVRIHRSHIVNLDRVERLYPWSHGDWRVVLRDGMELTLSRRYRDRLPVA